MKKIILVRHGKADDPVSGIADSERSLTNKGKIVSRLMAKKLKDIERSKMIFISSPAFRALETALIFAREFGIDPEKIILDSKIYSKMNTRCLYGILSKTGEEYEAVILFGHNPSITEIADSLCNDGCEYMNKSGVVGISFDADSWHEISHKTGKLEYDLKPEQVL
jgi:phosphohistidine phosphatase